ncbi:MAG TPA: hypothetical protein VNN79_08060, partial [Actinomycetota bacterium]|nr:hypothetical protein [Actinomycetota bacterium]
PPPGTFMTEKEQKEVDLTRALVEPLEFWEDKYPVEQTLEVEQPFVGWHLTSGARFIGRPDRVVVVYGKVFHQQHKTVGPGIGLGNYLTLAGRNMHELLYGAYLSQKYRSVGEYGGSIYDIVRKLKYRSTRVTKDQPKGVILHPAGEIFHQSMFALDVEQQEIALDDLNAASVAMDRTMDAYLQGLHIPSNRYFDSVNYGKGIDPYTLVMLGDAALDDDALFMDREDTYAQEEVSDDV